MTLDMLRVQLQELNQEIARFLRVDPVDITFQRGESTQDELYLYGVLGGKDVGKTSLINQLAGERISHDTDKLDEGTRVPAVYCHSLDRAALLQRLSVQDDAILLREHSREDLRNVVLIDFPDFDSRFDSHIEQVEQFAPFLQGFLWITTPRKYADRELFHQFARVSQHHDNCFVLLNKIDQLDGRATETEIRDEVLTTLNRAANAAGLPDIPEERFLLVSALDPSRYQFRQVYDQLIRTHSLEEIARAKARNIEAEFSRMIKRMMNVYQIESQRERLQQVREEIQAGVNEAFDDTRLHTITTRLTSTDRIHRRISGRIFQQKIEQWPILRSFFYPLSGVIAFMGGRFAYRSGDHEWSDNPQDLFRFQGESASGSLQAIQQGVMDQNPFVRALVPRSSDSHSETIATWIRRMLAELEENVVESLTAHTKPPSGLQKSTVFLPLIWFPFMQPVLAHLMTDETPLVSFSGIFEFLALLVGLLGAGNLLQSLVFLLIVYSVWLLYLYARSTRNIIAAGQWHLQQIWYEEWLPWASGLLSAPIDRIAQALDDYRSRIQAIQRSVSAYINDIQNKTK